MEHDITPRSQKLEIIDTSENLTYEELAELKRIVALSKISKVLVGIILGIISLFGLPEIFNWLSKHIH